MFKALWNRLSGQAEQWVNEWSETSAVRRRLRYSGVDRFLREAGEHPIAFLVDIIESAVLLTIIGWIFIRFHTPDYGQDLIGSRSNVLAYFSTLWTIQTTVAALVYPIVISFVAVLLRRRATATLGLRIYSLDAGVVPAGSSSIALVGWMGLQYLAMPFTTSEWIAAEMIGNAVWFILNTFLTSRFLFRTIRFLNDDDRLEVFQRFAIHVALPRDLRSRLMGIVLQRAQERKLLPGHSYSSEEAGPKVLVFPMAVGSPCLKIRVHRPREVIDVRLRLLGWAIWLWLRRAKTFKPGASIAGLGPEYPTLQIAFYPGQLLEGDVTVCRTSGAPELGMLAKHLIRLSIVLGQPTPKHLSYSTSDILEEIAAEIIELIEQKRYEAAFGMLAALADMHATLVQAGAFINDSGADDNATLLQDPYGLASRRLHEIWLDVYDELARLAVETLPDSSKPFEHHCYLTKRLVWSLRREHIDIVSNLLAIPWYLMFRLGSWWTSRVEERVTIHDHVQDAELPLPIGRIYEEAVQSFIGAWEGLDLWESREESEISPDTWTDQARRARFAVAHAERALNMLLEAVLRGDRTASLWLADSLLKWWSSRRYHFGEVDTENFQTQYANAACLTRDWSAVKALLAFPEGDEPASAADLVATILYRYWSDVRLVGVLVLLSWTPDDAPETALSLRIAIDLLGGRAVKEGGDADFAPFDARNVVLQMLRMQLVDDSYTNMLDRVVKNARELRRPRMIPGRIYDSSGADDLQSLVSAQALLLAGIIHYRTLLPRIEEFERIWSEDVRRSHRAERFARQLGSAFDGEGYPGRRPAAETIRRALKSQGALDSAEGRVRRSALRLAERIAIARTRAISAANVSQDRLDELSCEVSEFVLSDDNQIFPFVLSPMLCAENAATNPRSVVFSGARKAPYTDPLLEPGASLESASYREIVASRIGAGALIDYIHAKGLTALRVDSQPSFLAAIVAAAEALRSQGLTPLLVLPRYEVPEAARPWRYLRQAAPGKPDAAVKLRTTDDPKGVTAFFHDVPAYQAPISGSCFVVAREDFAKLRYVAQAKGSCISVSATPKIADTIDLKFEWMFGIASATATS